MSKAKKTTKREQLDWGAVKVIAGRHKGRIGYLDDEEGGGIVYFGDFFYAPRYHVICMRYLAPITTDDLMKRREELFKLIGMPNSQESHGQFESIEDHIEHLTEYAYVQAELMDRMFIARLTAGEGKMVFISHSSKGLSSDLCGRSHVATAA